MDATSQKLRLEVKKNLHLTYRRRWDFFEAIVFITTDLPDLL